ncbi:MAG: peptidoglycan bridge formation glycyltransferase FemA/FemB family protein [Chloroflexaceae bacterium]|nr:peptidoglycan bridge formation glycyltransferase FemA/FemB family protein [Chloroflexaceae bacterium]
MTDPAGYQLQRDEHQLNPVWDAFVAQHGHYQQSSRWAAARATLGWRAVRAVLWHTNEAQIVAGVQILLRPLARRGVQLWVGYVPYGPVLGATVAPVWGTRLVHAITQLARRYGAWAVLLIPPMDALQLRMQVAAAGWVLSPIMPAPQATTRIPVQFDPAVLLQRMRPATRYNARVGVRRGLQVRAGDAQDVPLLYAMLTATSQRKQFTLEPLGYYQQVWAHFAPHGQAWLMVAEYEQQVQAALLHVAWGDTVTYLAGGWAGTQRHLCPNDALHWASIQRARSAGYRWYDLNGVDRATVQACLRGAAVTSPDPVYAFKLGYGGVVNVLPDSYLWFTYGQACYAPLNLLLQRLLLRR